MRKLTAYLARGFASDAVTLFMIIGFLLWMVQCLRVFDVVSVKGQSLITLGYQGILSMPPLALTFAFVCVGIGLARALVALASNHELHIIHTSHGVKSLLRATGVLAVVSALVVLVISNFVAPLAVRQLSVLDASVTADLVATTLRPGRFTQVTPGVVLLIGGRAGNGEITEFFADDRRDPNVRRTYVAESATVAQTDEGYVLALRDGSLQSRERNRFSEVQFGQYNVNVERFTASARAPDPLDSANSYALVADAIASGEMSARVARELVSRMAEGMKVLGMCAMVLAIGGVPSGRRARFGIPLELVVIAIAFVELAVSSFGPLGEIWGPMSGSLAMLAAGVAILMWRLRPRRIGAPVADDFDGVPA